MKKIFTLMAVFALSMTAMAQNPVLKVAGKGNNQIVVSMDNDFNCGAFGFKLDLPEGAEIAYDEDEEDYVIERNTARVAKKATIDVKTTPTGGYSFNIYGLTVKGTEGELFTITLKAPVTGTATFKGINFTDVGEDGKGTTSVYMNNDKETVVTLDLKADAINGISADQTKSGVIYNLNGQRVNKAVKGVYVIDGKKVAVK